MSCYYYSWALMSYYSWALVSYFLSALENEVENEAIALGGGHGATTSDSREAVRLHYPS